MGKCTEDGPGTVARLLNVVAFGGLVDLRMELLLRPGVAVLAAIARLAIRRLAPLLAVLHIGTGRGPVLVLPWAAPLVLAVVILGTRVALPTEARWSLTWLRLVIGEYVVCVLPLRILIHQITLLVQGIRAVQSTVHSVLGILQCLQLFDVEHGRSLILRSMGKRTVVAILYTVATRIGIVDAHACFVVAQVIATFRIPRGPVQELAPKIRIQF